MSFDDFEKAAAAASRLKDPMQREGQFLVNFLSLLRPDLGAQMTADKPYDCFYVNARIPAFWAWVRLYWGA